MTGTEKTAIILFTMGGPDSLAAVKPFLFNLFNDPAILRVPRLVRFFLARLLAARRAKPAGEIYRLLGGKSPLLANTQAQAAALEAALGDPAHVRTFVVMRYWHPFSAEVVGAVKAFDPDRLILLPLYPQWSTTTSASSLADWREACRRVGLDKPTRTLCCYPTGPGFIGAMVALIRSRWDEAARYGKPRLLLSAHGLPKKVIAAGDPYQSQCEQTAAAVVAALGIPDLDWLNCYQSRVGPLEWIGPYTDAEIDRAGREGVPVVVVPIAFVSEHSETLVELDIEYRHLAERSGVPAYLRVPAVGVAGSFIDELAGLVRAAMDRPAALQGPSGGRCCPVAARGCAFDTETSRKVGA